jgi:hypothetical protein
MPAVKSPVLVMAEPTPVAPAVPEPEGLMAWYPLEHDLNDATGDNSPLRRKRLQPGGWRIEEDDDEDPFRLSGEAYLSLKHLSGGFGTGPYTLAVWVSLTSIEGDPFIFSCNRDTRNCKDELVVKLEGGRLSCWDHADGKIGFEIGSHCGTNVIPVDTWVHLAIVRDAEGVTHLYVNGVCEASRAPEMQVRRGNLGGPKIRCVESG